jgi:NDP-sugar pyrophosphorylase family protein
MIEQPFAPAALFNLEETEHRVVLENLQFAWEALPKLGPYLQFRLQPGIHGRLVGRPFVSDRVFIGEGTIIEQGAFLRGPAWIGKNCQIRAGCYIRENVIVGDGCVLGNSCEFKNCLLFNGVQVPHFNYVGDSILGHRAHLGAGVICSNVRLDHGEVVVRAGSQEWSTGLKKFGALVGDHAEVGCNSVLNPGSILGRRSLVYPGLHWRGVLPDGSTARLRQDLSVIPPREKLEG